MIPILGPIIKAFADSALGKISDAFIAYQNKQISQAQLEAQVKEAMIAAFAEVEKAMYEAMAKTFDSFMKQLPKSRLMKAVWASVAISQLLVLLWHQVGIPVLCYNVGTKACFPSSGSTVEWAYLLLGGCIGLGPMVLKSSSFGDVAGQLKNLVKK